MSSKVSIQTATCPRCGYDQRGVIATWTESCPMTGVCTECGLKVDWPDVLSDKVRVLKWNVEFAPHVRSLIWRSFKTLACTLWPWKFWRELKMTHKPRWRKIAAYLVIIHIAPLLLLPLLNGAAAAKMWLSFRFGVAQVQPGFSGMSPVPTVTWSTDVPLLKAVAMSVFLPFSSSSPGTITLTTNFPLTSKILGPHGYPTPLEQTTAFLQADTLTISRGRWVLYMTNDGPRVSGAFYSSGTGARVRLSGRPFDFSSRFSRLVQTERPFVLLIACMVAVFAILPQSRRAAKVRWTHIIRIAMYGFAVNVIPFALAALETHLAYLSNWTITASDQLLLMIGVCMSVAWFIWWSVAIGRYLRMKHAWGVGLAIVIVGALLWGAILFYGSQLYGGQNPFEFGFW